MDEPAAIEARGLDKAFQIPDHRRESLKERVLHPLTRVEYRELEALKDVTFDVRRGEFFGIVGRNGSGKSTLLKILAGIYRADAGTTRMAGSVAPFIELGVGFDPELNARENGVLNGVLMGLTKRSARARLDAILEFAELEDFAELPLKNYSSGMTVRLAFAVMVQAEADVMLIDEVLAVGDAAFAQKCMDVFHERRAAGKTIVFVTHDMGTVQSLCDRAMLLHDGELHHLGDPEETALRYYRLNFARGGAAPAVDERPAVPDFNAKVVHARLLSAGGEEVESVEVGQPLVLDVLLEARRELVEPAFLVNVMNADSKIVFSFTRTLDGPDGELLGAGRRVRLSGRIENPLMPGRYSVDCWVRREGQGGDMAVQGLRLLEMVVFGTPSEALVSVDADVEVVAKPRRTA